LLPSTSALRNGVHAICHHRNAKFQVRLGQRIGDPVASGPNLTNPRGFYSLLDYVNTQVSGFPPRAPYRSEEMVCWPVSPRVGNVKNNDPDLVEPIHLP
jgi:cytochrome c peroxidase